jgi:peroxiredoxin
MKKLLALFVSSLLVVSAYATVETGSPAPEFSLTDSTGKTHSLSDFKGSYVVLEWTNHQCPFVVKHYKEGHMQALQEKMTGKGVVWLQINSGAEGKQGHVTPEQAEALRESKGFKSTAYLLDSEGKVGRKYDARTTPHMYLIDPEGTLIYQGAIDSIKSTNPADVEKATNYVKAAYKSHKNGEPVDQPETVAYGCSVKY